MKNVFLFLIPICISLSVPAQKDFEGMIVYRNGVSSNIDGISNADWKKIFALSEIDTVTIKNGNFKQSSPRKDVYYISEKQKVFFRYKGIDTLYFLDYSEDTATVISVNKTGDKKKIAGYDCNAITIQTSQSTTRYYYSPAIYADPTYNQNNKINQYNVFAKETASLFLGSEHQTEMYTLKSTCLRVQETDVDADVFKLPVLPQTKFVPSSFIKLPEYAGKEGWAKYLQSTVNPEITTKYVKIHRKEDVASQSAMVSFTVSESGSVFNITVINKKEVHPKVAEEAIRVVSGSRWRPATAFGEKVPYSLTQPIIFQVVKQ